MVLSNTNNLQTDLFSFTIDGTPTRITTPGQSGPGNSGNEEVLHTLQPYLQLHLSVMPRIPSFCGGYSTGGTVHFFLALKTG